MGYRFPENPEQIETRFSKLKGTGMCAGPSARGSCAQKTPAHREICTWAPGPFLSTEGMDLGFISRRITRPIHTNDSWKVSKHIICLLFLIGNKFSINSSFTKIILHTRIYKAHYVHIACNKELKLITQNLI